MAIVVVSPYSPEWPKAFCAIREELLHVLSPCIMEIEHIGSTSVPGLAAKPILDILVGARSLTAIESKIPDLVSAGYEYVARYERELPNRRYFVKSTGPLRVHVHAMELGSAFWMEHLAFRNLLRSGTCFVPTARFGRPIRNSSLVWRRNIHRTRAPIRRQRGLSSSRHWRLLKCDDMG